ncbi:MAG: branched-chain amino acid ABC transporter permease [Actinobacteria bacterium]|nr:branched-chain amino acid ABC transporter permease [Actinomycetota bacterium]
MRARWVRRSVVALSSLLLLLLAGPAIAQTAVPSEAAAEASEAATEPGVEEPSETVFGFLRRPGEEGEEDVPVEGAQIVIRTDGQEVGTAETDADGRFEFGLPGPGQYEAELLLDTLPEGATLTSEAEDANILTFTIAPNQTRPLLFRLGESSSVTRGLLREFLQLSVEGVKFGLIIAMAAIGLSLVFGTTGLVNFAHGELVSFGAILAWFFNATLGMHLIPALLLALVVGAAFSGLVDLGLWRPLRRRGTSLIAMLVVSVGLSLFLRYAMLYQFGGRSRPYRQYAIQAGIDLGPIRIAPKDLIMVAVSIIVLIAVGLILQKTKIGKAMRAVADNRDLAASSGIDVQRVILFVWVLAGALATLGGMFLGLGEQVTWDMGFTMLLLMFAGVILGGLGTAYGALVGSLVVGLFVQLWALFLPAETKNVGAFVVLILVLLVRPQGILGRRERIG